MTARLRTDRSTLPPERKAIRSTSIACVGGNSRVCLGSFLMPKDETAESKKAFIEDVKAKSMGGGRVDLYEVLAERILPAIKWAESKGAQFEPWLQQAPWRVGVRIASPGQYRGMPKLLETLHDAFEKAGGKERF